MRLCSGCLLGARGPRCPPGLHVCLHRGPVSENLVQAHSCAARVYGSRPHHLSRSEPPGSRAPSPCTIDSRVPPEPTKAPSPRPRPPSRLSWYQSKSPFFLSSTVPDPCAVPSPGLFPHLTMKGFVSQPHPLRSQDATGDRIPDPSSPAGPTTRRALGPGPDTQPQHRPAHRPLPAFTRDAGRGRAGGRPFRPLPGSRAASPTQKSGTRFQEPGCYHITSRKVCQPAHILPLLHMRA